MKGVSIALLIIALLPCLARSQEEGSRALYLGVAPAFAMRWHGGELRTCDEADCLPFTDGSATGFGVALRAFHQLDDRLYLRGGIGWESSDGTFTVTRHHYPVLGAGNEVAYADLEDELEVTLPALIIDAGIAYRIMDPGIFLSAAPVLTLPLSPQWKQTERITAPAGLHYLDGSDSKVLLDGDVPDAGAFVSLRLGAGAMLHTGASFVLVPEISYTLPLTDMHGDLGWSVSGLDVSVGMMMNL